MESDAAGVILAGATRLEVLLICIKCFGDGERSALIDGFARLPACKLPRGLLSLPIGQDVRRGGGFEIIGEPDLLEPLPAKAIAAPNAPRARPREFLQNLRNTSAPIEPSKFCPRPPNESFAVHNAGLRRYNLPITNKSVESVSS